MKDKILFIIGSYQRFKHFVHDPYTEAMRSQFQEVAYLTSTYGLAGLQGHYFYRIGGACKLDHDTNLKYDLLSRDFKQYTGSVYSETEVKRRRKAVANHK